MQYECNLARDDDTGRYYAEVCEIETGDVLFRGPPCASRQQARSKAFGKLVDMMHAVAGVIRDAARPAKADGAGTRNRESGT